MNRGLINAYNKLVARDDILYIVGDFGYGSVEELKLIREQIKCENITFIWGNHDRALRSDIKAQREFFKETHDILDVKIHGQEITMCHYPFLEWNHFFYGSWHLFGHVHGNLKPMPGHFACDVGVDCHNYKPVSFEQIKEIMSRRKVFNSASMQDGLRPAGEPKADFAA